MFSACFAILRGVANVLETYSDFLALFGLC